MVSGISFVLAPDPSFNLHANVTKDSPVSGLSSGWQNAGSCQVFGSEFRSRKKRRSINCNETDNHFVNFCQIEFDASTYGTVSVTFSADA